MKKLIFFLCLVSLIVANKVSAQAYIYHPMVVDSATWQYSPVKDNNVYCLGWYNWTIYGDTIVDGTSYKKLDVGGNVFDLMRESNKKIIYRKKIDNFIFPEITLYDFSKNEGDTILTHQYHGTEPPDTMKSKVIKVDSINTQKGYRKRFVVEALNYGWLSSCDMPERFWFIEEIGSPVYFRYNNMVTVGGGGAPCEFSSYIVHKSTFADTLVIAPPGCLLDGIKEIQQKSKDSIYFEKTTVKEFGFYTLHNPALVKGWLEIYDTKGSLIQKMKLNSEKQVLLEKQISPNTLLIWKMYNELNKTYSAGKQLME